jgi:23S rRNA pseudouridine1911/1915/1917 synthase
MKLDIIYQDDQIVVVNKPADLLTIPDRHDATKPSLYGALNKLFGKVFIVHRLDRETSGILVFALNEAAHRDLSMQFEKRAKSISHFSTALCTPTKVKSINPSPNTPP